MSIFDRLFGKKTPEPAKPPAPMPTPPPEAAPLPEFPFPLVAVPGAEGVQVWKKYQAEWRAEGCSAVLLGDVEEVGFLNEVVSEGSVEDILKIANTLTAEQFFEKRRQENEENEIEEDVGEWPEEKVPTHRLMSHMKLLGKTPKKTVYLAKIPTAKSYEIPAYLKWGGWNACPAAEEHTAILHHWHGKYGIEIYAITGDVMECVASQPPTSQEAAMALAEEQYLYCEDIVLQGVGTTSMLAATLQGADAWFFWWD